MFNLFQLHRCPDLSDFQQKMASILSYNEKLQKEKEVLSEELNSCADKVVRTIDVLVLVYYSEHFPRGCGCWVSCISPKL